MRVLHWPRKHPVIILVVVVACIPVAFGVHWWYWPSIPATSATDVVAIDVHLIRWGNENDPEHFQKETSLSCTETKKIQALLDVFQNAERTGEHKCGSSGTLMIRKQNGSTEKLHILPGHQAEYYEYRYGSRINRVNRARFLAALRAMGVDQIKLTGP